LLFQGLRDVRVLAALALLCPHVLTGVAAQETPALIRGVVKTAEPGRNTITVLVRSEEGGAKRVDERTFEVGKMTSLRSVDVPKGQPPTDIKLIDLIAGTEVEILVAADEKTIAKLGANGPELYTRVKEVAADGSAITLKTKADGRLMPKAFRLGDGIKVLLNDWLSKEDRDQEGALLDLTDDMPVLVQLSLDQKTVKWIRVLGATLAGTLKSLDRGNAKIIVTVKENGGRIERTFALAKNARLLELTEGAPLVVRFSVFDKKIVVEAEGQKGEHQAPPRPGHPGDRVR
jgi:hypothetical protein